MASDPTDETAEAPRRCGWPSCRRPPSCSTPAGRSRSSPTSRRMPPDRGPNSSSSPRRSSAAIPRGTISASASACGPPRGVTSSAASSRAPSRCPERRPRPSARSARDHAVHLVVGVVERDGGTLYCTALIFGPDGTLLGKHRKLMPTAMERVIWGSGDGSTLPVVATHARQDRLGHLLGELHAPAADGDVRQGGRAVLRHHGGRPGDVAAHGHGTSPSKAAASSCRRASSSGVPTCRPAIPRDGSRPARTC